MTPLSPNRKAIFACASRLQINGSILWLVKLWGQNREPVILIFFYVHVSVLRESMSITVQQDATIYSSLYFCKLLYMFRVVTPPIIRSTYNCNYSIWHWSNRLCFLPLWCRNWNCRSSFNCWTVTDIDSRCTGPWT